MNKPRLKKAYIGKNKWAEHVGRGVNLVNDEGVLLSRLGLDEIERIRLESYEWRVNDAFDEYERKVQDG